MRDSRIKPILIQIFLIVPLAMHCGAQAYLTWNPNPDSTTTGYYVVWRTNSGPYTSTNIYPTGTISAQLDGLDANQVYYFNIFAYNNNGVTHSSPDMEVVFTNSLPETGTGTTNAGPPSPTISQPVANAPVSSSNPQPPATNLTQSLFWGVPPYMTMTLVSNGQPSLNIAGTVGASLTVEASPNIMSMDRWSEVTNISLTNIAPIALTNPPSEPPDALDLAFVPGLQSVQMPATNTTSSMFYRIVMPYDYVILASQVLPTKGYTPRLILVNMPGIVSEDACYVNQSSSFIHFDRSTYALQLQGSGSTIRQVGDAIGHFAKIKLDISL